MTTTSYVYTYDDARFYLESLWDSFTNATDPPKRFTFEDVFKVDDFKRAVYTSYDGAGPGLPQEREMLQTLAGARYLKGDPMTWGPLYFGLQMAIPQELVDLLSRFGEGDSIVAGQIADFANFTKAMRYNGWRKVDLEALDVLLNGTSTDARHVGRRGEALFSTSHASLGNPAQTASNLSVNLSPNETNLNFVLNAMMTQKDENGAPIGDDGGTYTIVHGQALASKFWTLTNTKQKTGSAENDMSYIYSIRDRIKTVNWPELDPGYTGWWVLGPKHGLRVKWMKKPHFDKQPEGKNNSIGYFMNQGARAFWEHWRDSYMVAPS